MTKQNEMADQKKYKIEHDGFEGTLQGRYITREGKRGVVLQQAGTRVVHVYGEKWLEGQGLPDDTVVSRTDYQAAVDTQKAIAMELLVQKKKYDKVLAVAKQMAGALEDVIEPEPDNGEPVDPFIVIDAARKALTAFEQLEKEG